MSQRNFMPPTVDPAYMKPAKPKRALLACCDRAEKLGECNLVVRLTLLNRAMIC